MSTIASTSCGDSPAASIASKSERVTSPLTASTRTRGSVSARVTSQLPGRADAMKRTHELGA